MDTNKIEEFLAAHAEHPCSVGWGPGPQLTCQDCGLAIEFDEADYREYLSGLSVPDYLIEISNPF